MFAAAIYRVVQKKAHILMHHHFATVRNRVTRFLRKRSDINC